MLKRQFISYYLLLLNCTDTIRQEQDWTELVKIWMHTGKIVYVILNTVMQFIYYETDRFIITVARQKIYRPVMYVAW